MTDQRIRVVEQGYDVLADRFLEWSKLVEGDPRPQLVERFMEGLRDGAAGAIEAMFCTQAIRDGVVPPTIN